MRKTPGWSVQKTGWEGGLSHNPCWGFQGKARQGRVNCLDGLDWIILAGFGLQRVVSVVGTWSWDDVGRGIQPPGMHWPDTGGLALPWLVCTSKACFSLSPLSEDWLDPGGAVSPQPESFFKMPEHHNIQKILKSLQHTLSNVISTASNPIKSSRWTLSCVLYLTNISVLRLRDPPSWLSPT